MDEQTRELFIHVERANEAKILVRKILRFCDNDASLSHRTDLRFWAGYNQALNEVQILASKIEKELDGLFQFNSKSEKKDEK